MDVKPNVIDVIGKEILNHAQDKPNGLTNEELVEIMPNVTAEQTVTAVNKLVQQGQMEILRKNNSLLYRIKDPTKKSVVPKGADNEEKIVYSIIEEGGNKGIWIRDIRVKSNLIMTQLNKILKNLENKKLIKAVKSVNVSCLKFYQKVNFQTKIYFYDLGKQKESIHAIQFGAR